jgi:hypothetical protein
MREGNYDKLILRLHQMGHLVEVLWEEQVSVSHLNWDESSFVVLKHIGYGVFEVITFVEFHQQLLSRFTD